MGLNHRRPRRLVMNEADSRRMVRFPTAVATIRSTRSRRHAKAKRRAWDSKGHPLDKEAQCRRFGHATLSGINGGDWNVSLRFPVRILTRLWFKEKAERGFASRKRAQQPELVRIWKVWLRTYSLVRHHELPLTGHSLTPGRTRHTSPTSGPEVRLHWRARIAVPSRSGPASFAPWGRA